MRIDVNGSGRFGLAALSLEAENEAERHQIEHLKKELKENNVEWSSWNDMYCRDGITIMTKVKE